MNIDRRNFIKVTISSSLISLSAISLYPTSETVADKIKRLFAKSIIRKTHMSHAELLSLIAYLPLEIRKSDNELLKLSDEDFIKIIDKNIRQDFYEDRIINLAGWQLAYTEAAIILAPSKRQNNHRMS